jgi:aspartate kinase
VALAAGLGISECEIYTDVPAVFTADPRVVPEARRVSVLRHDEMLEMAEAGAGVLQPRIELAAARGVDVHVRSSFTTETGTWIRAGRVIPDDDAVVGVAHRDHDCMYTARGICSARLTAALGARGAAAGAIVPETDVLRFTAPSVEAAEVAAALAAIGAEVAVHDGLGTVSVIRTGIGRRPDVIAGPSARSTTSASSRGSSPRRRAAAPRGGRLPVRPERHLVHVAGAGPATSSRRGRWWTRWHAR